MITRRAFVGTMGIAAVGAALGLTGCGGASTAPKVDYKRLGDTVSSDMLEFTLKKADLSFYSCGSVTVRSNTEQVVNPDECYVPESEAPEKYPMTASKGHVLVCMEFKVKNNDRADLDVGGTFADWMADDFKAVYQGNEYAINGYDLNDLDGNTFGMNLQHAMYSGDDGATWYRKGTTGCRIEAGSEKTFRAVGIACFEPENLTDPFDFKVTLLNSSKEKDEFVFRIGD